MNEKIFGLIDCNSFYASCERVFRPDLKRKPVIVLSNNDGCVISRSDEAKSLGIAMGVPFFKIKELCRQKKVSVFSSNFGLYTNFSMRVMDHLKFLCPKIEVYSVDEAFLDLTGIKDPLAFGHHLRSEILRVQKIPTAVGIAPTKVMAKLADGLAKKSPKAKGVVCLLDKRLQDMALARTPIEEVWGIGRRSAEKMKGLGIDTALKLRDYERDDLIQKYFTKVGLAIKNELRGISCYDLVSEDFRRKEIMCSRSFGRAVTSLAELKEAVATYTANAAVKLRSQGSVCKGIVIFASTGKYQNEQDYLRGTRTFANPTCDSLKLIKYALELLEEVFKEGVRYKKAGVRLFDISQEDELQMDFLSPMDTEKDLLRMKLMDFINSKEGAALLKSAACGTHAPWGGLKEYKSPNYTSNFKEVMTFF